MITINRIFKLFIIFMEKFSPYFFSYKKRPKYADDINEGMSIKIEQKQLAIVMQGPIISKENFTYETLKLYKKSFDGALLILSTWKGEDTKQIQLIKDLEVHIIQNEMPDNRGISNVNLQIVSTKTGIKYAKDNGYKYCIKTRTDQRIYRYNVFQFLKSIQESFPLKNVNKQDKRLVSVSLNTFKHRLYGITDMFMFGSMNDMLLYWDVEMDERKKMPSFRNLFEYCKANICEVYFATSFFKKLGYKINWTAEDYCYKLKQSFCIVDTFQIDLFWHKYNRFLEENNRQFVLENSKEEVCFSDWLRVFNNINDVLSSNTNLWLLK